MSAGDEDERFGVHVRPASSGAWWTIDVHGEVLSQWQSEFAAIDAGRLNARRLALPLVIHDLNHGSRTEPAEPDDA